MLSLSLDDDPDEIMKKNSVFKFDLLILSILAHSDSYGYEISAYISEKSEGVIHLQEGVIYPILYKLLKLKMISNYEKEIDGRIRVYYRIELKGVQELQKQTKDFNASVIAIRKIIERE